MCVYVVVSVCCVIKANSLPPPPTPTVGNKKDVAKLVNMENFRGVTVIWNPNTNRKIKNKRDHENRKYIRARLIVEKLFPEEIKRRNYNYFLRLIILICIFIFGDLIIDVDFDLLKRKF